MRDWSSGNWTVAVPAWLAVGFALAIGVLPVLLYAARGDLDYGAMTALNSRDLESLMRSVAVSSVGVAAQLGAGLTLALLLYWRGVGWRVAFLAAAASLAVSPLVAGLIWASFLDYAQGGMNLILGALGLPGIPWLSGRPVGYPPQLTGYSELNWGQVSTLLIDSWLWSPFVASLCLLFIKQVPRALVESALIESGSRLRVSLRVLLPLALPGILLIGLYRFLDLYRAFELNYVIFGTSAPGQLATTRAYVLSYLARNHTAAASLSIAQLLLAVPFVIALLAYMRVALMRTDR